MNYRFFNRIQFFLTLKFSNFFHFRRYSEIQLWYNFKNTLEFQKIDNQLPTNYSWKVWLIAAKFPDFNKKIQHESPLYPFIAWLLTLNLPTFSLRISLGPNLYQRAIKGYGNSIMKLWIMLNMNFYWKIFML